MLADLSYANKLWNKGVDIGAGVVTSVIVGAIGLAFWRAKLWLDLRSAAEHQRQEHRIGEELELKKKRGDALERRRQVKVRAEVFAQQAEAAPSSHALGRIWDAYVEWLMQDHLNLLPGNTKILEERAVWSHVIRDN